MVMDDQAFVGIALRNPANRVLIERLAAIGLPQCHLTAGCLFQTLWNVLSGWPPTGNIKDYDVFYFDSVDLSWEAEDAVIRRVAPIAAELGIPVEVKNQARVHLWYEQRFGTSYPQLTSARDGISRYLVRCTCVGIDVKTREVFAPDGYGDLAAGILRVNPLFPQPEQFRRKAAQYKARWPWLRVIA